MNADIREDISQSCSGSTDGDLGKLVKQISRKDTTEESAEANEENLDSGSGLEIPEPESQRKDCQRSSKESDSSKTVPEESVPEVGEKQTEDNEDTSEYFGVIVDEIHELGVVESASLSLIHI